MKWRRQKDETQYKRIMQSVCDQFYPQEANLDDFINKAFPKLPWKMQKHLTTYYGLEGGINHEEKIQKMLRKGKPIPDAERELNRNALIAINQLGKLDCMVLFHPKVQELVRKIAQKTYGEADELLATKWAEMYAVMILNGPYLILDENRSVQDKKELNEEGRKLINRMYFLEIEYDNIFKSLQDGELSIEMIKHWEEDQDIVDRISIRRFFDIEIPKYLQEFEEKGEDIFTFLQIRKLKEKIFFNGPWATDGYLFLKRDMFNKENMEKLQKIFELLRQGAKLERSIPDSFPFGTGEKEVKWFLVRDEEAAYEFPYYEEVMFLRFMERIA